MTEKETQEQAELTELHQRLTERLREVRTLNKLRADVAAMEAELDDATPKPKAKPRGANKS